MPQSSELSPLARAIQEAIAQAQAGATLLFAHDDDRVVQQGRMIQHWRGDALQAEYRKAQGWKRVIAAMVGMALDATAAPEPAVPPAKQVRAPRAPRPAPAGQAAAPAARPARRATSRRPPSTTTLPTEAATSPVALEGTMPQLWTEGGYVLGEVISALQKEIRRGNEQEAMYWALELVPKYEAYL